MGVTHRDRYKWLNHWWIWLLHVVPIVVGVLVEWPEAISGWLKCNNRLAAYAIIFGAPLVSVASIEVFTRRRKGRSNRMFNTILEQGEQFLESLRAGDQDLTACYKSVCIDATVRSNYDWEHRVTEVITVPKGEVLRGLTHGFSGDSKIDDLDDVEIKVMTSDTPFVWFPVGWENNKLEYLIFFIPEIPEDGEVTLRTIYKWPRGVEDLARPKKKKTHLTWTCESSTPVEEVKFKVKIAESLNCRVSYKRNGPTDVITEDGFEISSFSFSKVKPKDKISLTVEPREETS